jgi:hypothetical protein
MFCMLEMPLLAQFLRSPGIARSRLYAAKIGGVVSLLGVCRHNETTIRTAKTAKGKEE